MFYVKYFITITSILIVGCSKKTYSGNIYLVDSYSKWDSSEYCLKFIENQVIPKEYMKRIPYGTELTVENDKVIGVNRYNYGRKSSNINFIPFSYSFNDLDIEKHIPYEITKGTVSKSYLGGRPPDGFKIPFYNDEISFQYFGLIAKDDFPSDLLKFDLHLVAPIFDSFTELYLDYSNPLEPKIIKGAESQFTRTFDEMNSNSIVLYEETAINYSKGGSLIHGYGYTGAPYWIQGPYYPLCPISGKEMIFLMSLNMLESREGIKVESLNFTVNENIARYFKYMEFWITGAIYIFINPKQQTVCYFLQST